MIIITDFQVIAEQFTYTEQLRTATHSEQREFTKLYIYVPDSKDIHVFHDLNIRPKVVETATLFNLDEHLSAPSLSKKHKTCMSAPTSNQKSTFSSEGMTDMPASIQMQILDDKCGSVKKFLT